MSHTNFKSFYFILVFFFGLFLINNLLTPNLEVELAKKQRIIDSLESELFVTGTIITRYQVTLEKLHERNVKCAKEFEQIMEMETE
jgi:hypothetical protein